MNNEWWILYQLWYYAWLQKKMRGKQYFSVFARHPIPDVTTAKSGENSFDTSDKKSEKKSIKTEPKPSDYTSIHLCEADLQEIVARIGTRIENIYDLTPGQKWMLGDGSSVDSDFFLQFLFKAVIHLEPYSLRKKLEEVFDKRDNLRSAYLSKGLSRSYRVVLKNRQAELIFEDLSQLVDKELDEKLESIMEADRKRGFDLERDTLLRISVYKTGAKDTYAILLSQPHINTDGMSTMMLLKDIFVDYAFETEGLEQMLDSELPGVSFEEYAKWMNSQDREVELAYWKDALNGMKASTVVPGLISNIKGKSHISQMNMMFSPDTQLGIKQKQTAFHATANSIMQAAWSILLMKMYDTQDVSFGAITSGREAQVKSSAMLAGGFVNAIPVRANADGSNMRLSAFVQKLQMQFMTSLSHGHCSPDEIRKMLNWKEPIFDHLLNFHNFDSMFRTAHFTKGDEKHGIRLIDGKMFDNLSMALTIYFYKQDEGIGCKFVYDQRRLSDARIRILMTQFEHVVDQMARGSDELTLGDISCCDIHVFDGVYLDEQAMREEIISFMSGLEVFSEASSSEISLLAESARVTEYMKEDTIIREKGDVHDILFVLKGSVEMHRRASDGWIHPFMILRSGKMISASGVWDEEHSYFGVRAHANGTRVLRISGAAMRSVMAREPSIGRNIMKELYRRAGSLSLLWINQ